MTAMTTASPMTNSTRARQAGFHQSTSTMGKPQIQQLSFLHHEFRTHSKHIALVVDLHLGGVRPH